MNYDLAIIGGGPAGVSAGVYASRKRIKTLFLTKDFDGQSTVSDKIENWIGTVAISGRDLSASLEAHLRAYAGTVVDIHTGELATLVEKIDSGFRVTTSKGSYTTKTVLITAGSKRRKLEVPGASEFEHKGIVYCATCDGPLFADQDVAVIGGGNAAFESAAQLLAYCKSVTLINRGSEFRADPVTVEKLLAHPQFKALTNAKLSAIFGSKFVEGLRYTDTSGTEITLAVTGVFAEIGSVPNTDMVKNLVTLDQYGRIEIDPWRQRASIPGVWAAGDCTNILYHQNNIASGDAVKALEDIYGYLHA